MIALWMFYCVAMASLLAAAAYVLEYGLRAVGRPARWVWAVAIGGSLFLAAAPWLAEAEPPSGTRPIMQPGTDGAATPPSLSDGEAGVAPRAALPDRGAVRRLGDFDTPLLALWGALSTAGGLVLLGEHGRLRRRRRSWRRVTVDGVTALLSRDVGPAVVGFRDVAIVLPEWVEALDAERRRLVVAHEEEHVRAGDVRLLAFGLGSLVLTPWCVPLWWQVKRLRHAVEVDCDARVIARYPAERVYGALLVEIGERTSRRDVGLAAFSEPVTLLERRVMALFTPRSRRWRARLGTTVILAAGVLAAAAAVPAPGMNRPAVVVAQPALPGTVSIAPAEADSLVGEQDASLTETRTPASGIIVPSAEPRNPEEEAPMKRDSLRAAVAALAAGIVAAANPAESTAQVGRVRCDPPVCGQIVGTVVDAETGEPIRSVQIYGQGTRRGTLSRADGSFLIQTEPGAYTLVAQRIGYVEISQPLRVSADSITTVTFSMVPGAVALQAIVVNGATPFDSTVVAPTGVGDDQPIELLRTP